MKTNYPISICVPCYNCEDYIEKLFKTIERQSFNNFEVIFLDDGSTDDTYNKLLERKERSPLKDNMKIFHQENKGLSFSRNKLIQLATGTYITFLDSDDKLTKNALRSLWKHTNNGEMEIVIGRAHIIYRKHIHLPYLPGWYRGTGLTAKEFAENNICVAWGSLLKKDYIEQFEFNYKQKSFEDVGIMVYAILKSNKFKSIRSLIYYYYRNGNSLSTFSEKNKWKFLDLYYQAENLLKKCESEEWTNDPKYKKVLDSFSYQVLLGCGWLSNLYSHNNYLNTISKLSILLMLKHYNSEFKFTFMHWKISTYGEIRKTYKKLLNKDVNHLFNEYINKIVINKIDDENSISNDETHFYLIGHDFNEEVINSFEKCSFLTTNNLTYSKFKNCYYGIKPNKITDDILKNQEIYFIDLTSFKKITNKELDILKKINTRILIITNEDLKIDLINSVNIL